MNFNGQVVLEISISNGNPTALTGVSFVDALPLSPGTLNALAIVSLGSGCASATHTSTSLTLSSGTVAANSQCTYRAVVTGTASGSTSNTVVVSSYEANDATSNTANLVVQPP